MQHHMSDSALVDRGYRYGQLGCHWGTYRVHTGDVVAAIIVVRARFWHGWISSDLTRPAFESVEENTSDAAVVSLL